MIGDRRRVCTTRPAGRDSSNRGARTGGSATIPPFVRLIGLASMLSLGCDTRPPAALSDITFDPVTIVGTDLLIAPGVGYDKAYKPSSLIPLEQTGSMDDRAAAFYLTVITSRPQAIKARLKDVATGEQANLVRIADPPVPSDPVLSSADLSADSLGSDASETLRSGRGVFALVEGDEGDPLVHRLVFIVPEQALNSMSRLSLHVAETPDGTAIGADSIDLVEDFFYVAEVGDSILWGSGLPRESKFTSIVAEFIERQTGKRVIRQVPAQSGAEIVAGEDAAPCGFSCNGEAPSSATPIPLQVDRLERPDLLDLVLVSGCINDVSVAKIVSPDTPPEEIASLTREFCGDAMLALLLRIRARAPQAFIVVTGYYPIISPQTRLQDLQQWIQINGQELTQEQLEVSASNSTLFEQTARTSIEEAVAAAAVSGDSENAARIALADARFGPENALFAPQSWVWGLSNENPALEGVSLNAGLLPEDPLLRRRTDLCARQNDPENLLPCIYSAVGHPNVSGARRYADAVIDALNNSGALVGRAGQE